MRRVRGGKCKGEKKGQRHTGGREVNTRTCESKGKSERKQGSAWKWTKS